MSETFIKVIVIFSFAVGVLFLAYKTGEQTVQAKWDIEKGKMEKEAADLRATRQKETTKVVIRYVTKNARTSEKSSKINDAVTKYVPKTTECIIPNNAVTLLDASAKNMVIPGEFQFKMGSAGVNDK